MIRLGNNILQSAWKATYEVLMTISKSLSTADKAILLTSFAIFATLLWFSRRLLTIGKTAAVLSVLILIVAKMGMSSKGQDVLRKNQEKIAQAMDRDKVW